MGYEDDWAATNVIIEHSISCWTSPEQQRRVQILRQNIRRLDQAHDTEHSQPDRRGRTGKGHRYRGGRREDELPAQQHRPAGPDLEEAEGQVLAGVERRGGNHPCPFFFPNKKIFFRKGFGH